MESEEQIKYTFVEKTKEVFDIPHSDYVTHKTPRFNCVQVWKRGWSTSKEVATHKGIHYEIQFAKDLDHLNEKDTQVKILIHNESSDHRIPNKVIPKTRDLFSGSFDFDTAENAERSTNDIIAKLKEVASNTEVDIDRRLKSYQEQF